MTTLKDYLTADMRDEPQTYREWLDSLPVINENIYLIGFDRIPYRPIYGYRTNLITYPYTVPYKDS